MMQLSNARYNSAEHTSFDVDVTLGGETFPFSYHPLDGAPLKLAIDTYINDYGLAIANYVRPTPTFEDFSRAIEKHVNKTATERGYSSAVSCASYVTSTIDKWAAEARVFAEWRDNLYVYAFTELEKVQSRQIEVPALDAFLTELPAIEWPE